MTDQFLIEKRGLYYRPNAQGYTGLKRCAGRYSFEEAAEYVGPNGPDGSQDVMSMWHEEEAPEYAPACYRDIRDREEGRKEGVAEAAAEIERLTALLQSSSAQDWEGFSRAILENWPTGDIDGAHLFDMALKYGMIAEVPGGYDPEQHIDAEGICPETGDPWYEYTFQSIKEPRND